MNQDDKYLTVDEVARIVKCNPNTVRMAIKKGHLPHGRVGRLIRVDRDDIDPWVKSGCPS